MMAADALIAEVAGNDEAWMAHIAEEDAETQEDWGMMDSGLKSGFTAVAA